MIDYSIFYRRTINVERLEAEIPYFDFFISAYNESDRVNIVFNRVTVGRKIWLNHPEYCFTQPELPIGFSVISPASIDEVVQVNEIIKFLGGEAGLAASSICVDTTGFMRHVLIFLIAKLAHCGVQRVSFLYSEPVAYTKQEDTPFSTTTSGLVRPVRGLSRTDGSSDKDQLIIGVGYDHKLISEVVGNKDDAEVYPIFGFPSLGADMYQQGAVRAAASGDVARSSQWVSNRRFAPANDPFATADAVAEIVRRIDAKYDRPNVYLAPLSTKAQTLGFAIYWQLEGAQRGGVSVLMPECLTYSRETSTGLNRLWLYDVELDYV